MLYRLIAFNGRYTHSCPALFYVREELEKNAESCSAEILQFTINDPYYSSLRSIGSGKPDAFFFSVYIWSSLYIQRLVTDLVKIHPGVPVILGGPQAVTLVRDLEPKVLEQCTVVDGEVEGVGDSFYRDLAAGILKRRYDCTCPQTFASPYRPDDFSGPLQNRYVYYESSRGCPFGCTYCLSASEKAVRRLETEQVFKELENILQHDPKTVRFVDRTFNDQPERALEIWRFLAEQPGETLFHFEMAPDRFTEEMFDFLARVGPGRFQFEIGVQSTNPETLAAINRKCDLEKTKRNIPRLASLDTIHLHLDLILGLPQETRESFARSFAEVFALDPHYIQMGLLKILPGTPISQSVENYSMAVCTDPPYEILANRWLDKGELDDLYWFGECVESFYNNRFFRNFWNYLRRNDEDIFAFFVALQRLCYEKSLYIMAPTQELLSSLLAELAESRKDRELIREILAFDWLRCGHKFLPDHLAGVSLAEQKKDLRRRMAQNWEEVYDYKSREEFFKQGVFFSFSGKLLREVGLSEEDRTAPVCFLPERENIVFRFNRALLIPAGVLGT